MNKKMILVTSPPACGKTYISKKLAEELKHVVYLDKDTLIVLSNRFLRLRARKTTEARNFLKRIFAITNMRQSSQ